MKRLTTREINALDAVLQYCACEEDHYNACLQSGEDVGGHIWQQAKILLDYFNDKKRRPRFELGFLCATSGAMAAIEEAREQTKDWSKEPADAAEIFTRHQCAEWRHMNRCDKLANEDAIENGFQIMSGYKLKATGQDLWVVTDGKRIKTTIMLPDEYNDYFDQIEK